MEAAQRILNQRGWCLYEVCLDIPRQRWEPRVLMFDLSAEAVADALDAEIRLEPEHDARLTGVDRRTLQPITGTEAYLCYMAELSARPDDGSAHESQSTSS